MRATVIADASFCNLTKRNLAGWAAWVRIDGHPHPIKKSGPILRVEVLNSTHAEVYAIVNGLAMAVHRGATDVLLQTDCLNVVQAINGEAQAGPKLTAFVLLTLAKVDLEGVQIRAKHVRGHTGKLDARSYVNDWCDKKAKKHMRTLRKKVQQGR
jgi:ribonuclease HI